MKKKYVYFLVLFLVLIFSSTANAVEITKKISLFTGSIFYHNNEVQMSDPVIIYNGKTYAPLREFAQSLGGIVGYNKENRSIHIDQPYYSFGKSEINQKVKNEEFTLRIFSKKATYKQGEPLEIWAHLTNESDQSVSITHSEPLMGYNIQDDAGFEENQILALSLEKKTFNPGDEWSAQLSPFLIIFYNGHKQGINVLEYLNESDRPSLLPKGKYTITAEANYYVGWGDDRKKEMTKLKSSISITIV